MGVGRIVTQFGLSALQHRRLSELVRKIQECHEDRQKLLAYIEMLKQDLAEIRECNEEKEKLRALIEELQQDLAEIIPDEASNLQLRELIEGDILKLRNKIDQLEHEPSLTELYYAPTKLLVLTLSKTVVQRRLLHLQSTRVVCMCLLPLIDPNFNSVNVNICSKVCFKLKSTDGP